MVTALSIFFKWTFIVLAVLLIAGVIFEQYSRWSLERDFKKGKTFVEINGRPLHYVKKGTGNCTIVFQSGMGSNHFIWKEIQDSLSKDAVTLSYDRNGLLLSDATGQPPTNDLITAELQQLLEKTTCPKPYILVGHSMAGIYLRPFIKNNEKDISGIVFVEAAHPLQMKKASPKLLKALSVPPHWLIKFMVNTGIYRTVFSFMPLSPEIPVSHPLHQLEKDFFYRSCNKILEEAKNDTSNFEDAMRYTSFGNIPLTVIMGNAPVRYAGFKDPEVREEFKQLVNEVQHDLLKLSKNSRLIKAEHSGHIPQIHENNLIIAEIRKNLNPENVK
ncbi:hypothetical protein DBR43_09145 [Pedobacter sp. KBW06]|uniref:alpha/beta fold hydrolase n=1 Tax=Pedobacter sp. KBW06 TaxID=2153359 RepID=UPI000F5994FF|nr:alpha/beta hydrolase [Pedobacter sp. KBW06]RQO75500.1 hypothetical protein DBR43_09145 [Pedobacter sp. KBW06]